MTAPSHGSTKAPPGRQEMRAELRQLVKDRRRWPQPEGTVVSSNEEPLPQLYHLIEAHERQECGGFTQIGTDTTPHRWYNPKRPLC